MSTCEYEYEFGDDLTDKISGFRGYAVARTHFPDGTTTYQLQPRTNTDAELPKAEWFAEQQLERSDQEPKVGFTVDLNTTEP